MAVLLVGACLCIEFEEPAPAPRCIDRLAEALRGFAQSLEVPMFQIDACARSLGREQDLHLGNEAGVELPLGVELPSEEETGRRVPDHDLADIAFGTVDIEFVP